MINIKREVLYIAIGYKHWGQEGGNSSKTVQSVLLHARQFTCIDNTMMEYYVQWMESPIKLIGNIIMDKISLIELELVHFL